jgi:ABC-type Fe3+ transport system permease subunit
VRVCASCGLGVVGEPDRPEAVLRELDRVRGEHGSAIANRAGFAASLGGPGWAALGPGARYLFTLESVRRLVARRDQVVRWRRSLSGSIVLTWQTLLNSVTFGHNVAFAALRWGEFAAAERPWQRRIDVLASVVLAVPALALALAIELAAAPFGRGAVIMVRTELL